MNCKDLILEVAAGNPCAMDVLVQCIKQDADTGEKILQILKSNKILGSDIWILYKDKLGCDITTFIEHVLDMPQNTDPL